MGLPSRPMLVFLGGLVVLAVVMAIAWGPRAAVVLAALVIFVALLAYAVSLGGGVVRDASRGRFRRDGEHR